MRYMMSSQIYLLSTLVLWLFLFYDCKKSWYLYHRGNCNSELPESMFLGQSHTNMAQNNFLFSWNKTCVLCWQFQFSFKLQLLAAKKKKKLLGNINARKKTRQSKVSIKTRFKEIDGSGFNLLQGLKFSSQHPHSRLPLPWLPYGKLNISHNSSDLICNMNSIYIPSKQVKMYSYRVKT